MQPTLRGHTSLAGQGENPKREVLHLWRAKGRKKKKNKCGEIFFRGFSRPVRFFGPKKRPSLYAPIYHTEKKNYLVKMEVFPDSDFNETKTKRILIRISLSGSLKKVDIKSLWNPEKKKKEGFLYFWK